ncbi:MAG: MFS transporter [Chromatiales bacterium]|nr:MAG: MFS transporter [Chromatiales bacterium]
MNQASNYHIGPVEFAPGISGTNAWTFLFLNFMIMPIVAFLSISQPYVLSEIVGIPPEEHGRITGFLVTMQEIVALLLIGSVGALSDRFGRRPLFALGVFIAGIGFALYSTAQSELDLYLYRFVYAVGVATAGVMIAVTAADYPAETSRGKLAGVTGFLNGLGVALAAALILPRLPAVFQAMGASAADAGRYMLLVMATAAIVTAIVMQAGLKGGTPTGRSNKVSLRKAIRTGLAQGRASRRLAVCYAGSFVARADLTLVAVFVSLWLQQTGRNEGLDAAAAFKQAGIMLAIIPTSSLLWAPVAGFLIDRFHRLASVCAALLVAGIGYVLLGLQENPFTTMGYLAAVLVGIGQMSVILTVTGLLGQETPLDVRGSVIGFASLCGAAGILVTSLAGGYIYDHWMISGPIILTGIANLAVFAFALLVWLGDGRPVRFDPGEARSAELLEPGHS